MSAVALPSRDEVRAERARRRMGDGPAVLAEFASKGRWQSAAHLGLINSQIRRAEIEPLRLVITTPPRHGKSSLISQYSPAWFVGRNPQRRVLLASYEADFASGWGRRARDVLEEHGESLFGVTVRSDSSAANRWEIRGHSGGMATAGVGGALTGKGADLLIIDDPVKNSEEANSQDQRDKIWNWFLSTAYTRLEPHGSIVVVMTRWHEDDLVGRLLADSELGVDWEVIRLPSLILEDDDLPDPLGRTMGEPLWPDRFDSDYLLNTRQLLGSYLFSALYQGSPAPTGGLVFKREWFKFWRAAGDGVYDLGAGRVVSAEECSRLVMVDLAAREKESADYTVVGTFDVTPRGEIILVDLIRRRLEGPDIKPVISQAYHGGEGGRRASLIGVESTAFQLSLVQELRRQGLPVLELRPEKDKFSRALTAAAKMEASSSSIYFEQQAPWFAALERELLSFPTGRHDDQVDVIAYAAIEAAKWTGDWDSAYGVRRCESCGHGFVDPQRDRACPQCGASA